MVLGGAWAVVGAVDDVVAGGGGVCGSRSSSVCGSSSSSLSSSGESESWFELDVVDVAEERTEGDRDGGAEEEDVDDEDVEEDIEDVDEEINREGEGERDFEAGGDGEVIRKGPFVFLFKAMIDETCWWCCCWLFSTASSS
jgi:hypothetical protein